MKKSELLKKAQQKHTKNTFDSVNKSVQSFQQGQDYIKSRIRIKDEIRDFIDPLTEEEFQQLEANIRKDGVCREALILWKVQDTDVFYIIDGHNRYRVCSTHHIPFQVTVMEFANIHEVFLWMVNNQLGRRNLDSKQKARLMGKAYNSQGATDTTQNLKQNQKNSPSKAANKAEDFAKKHDVDKRTVYRASNLEKGLQEVERVHPGAEAVVMKEKTVTQKDLEAIGKETDPEKKKEMVGLVVEKANNPTKRKVRKNTPKKVSADITTFIKLRGTIQSEILNRQKGSISKGDEAVIDFCEQLLNRIP